MSLKKINDRCYYFEGAVNIGYICNEDKGLLIDAGIDAAAMKKVVKQLEAEKLPINYLLITHAHADHYGGAAFLQRQKEIKVYAPELEAAILENPILEPIYLFHGTNPLAEIRNKFLEGEKVRVNYIIEPGNYEIGPFQLDILSLPGHSYNQIGLLAYDVLYAADSYFGVDALKKHGIPYIVDADETLKTIEALKKVKCDGAVPGHGPFEIDYEKTLNENIVCHERILSFMRETISETGLISFDQLLKQACSNFEVTIKNVPSWLLYRTAVTAYVTKLVKDTEVELYIDNYELMIKVK